MYQMYLARFTLLSFSSAGHKLKYTHFFIEFDLTYLSHQLSCSSIYQHLLTLQSKLKVEDGHILTVGRAMFCGICLFIGYTCRTCPASSCVNHRQNKMMRFRFVIVLCLYFLNQAHCCEISV